MTNTETLNSSWLEFIEQQAKKGVKRAIKIKEYIDKYGLNAYLKAENARFDY